MLSGKNSKSLSLNLRKNQSLSLSQNQLSLPQLPSPSRHQLRHQLRHQHQFQHQFQLQHQYLHQNLLQLLLHLQLLLLLLRHQPQPNLKKLLNFRMEPLMTGQLMLIGVAISHQRETRVTFMRTKTGK